MVLIYVLWTLALLSSLAVSLLSLGNTSYRLSHNALEAARAEAAADAAMVRAVLALIDPRVDRRWRVDGVSHKFSFDGFNMAVAIQDELGRIDLNHADRPLLLGLLQSAGLDFRTADGLVDKVLDWRDASPGRRPNGATIQDYQSAGLGTRPRKGPFQSIEELKLVMGMTPELYGRVEPALTVYSGRQFLDPQFAPKEALAALGGMNPDAIASVLAARTSRGARAGIPDTSASLRGRAFSVRIEADKKAGAPLRHVVVRLTDQATEPYWVLSWRTR